MGQNCSSRGTTLTMPFPVDVIVVGAGSRGEIYSHFASIHPQRMKVVGVADPREFARNQLKQLHRIADDNIFEDWHCLVEREKFADAVLICTPDRLHKEPAVAFAKKGYNVLLEKPMAVHALILPGGDTVWAKWSADLYQDLWPTTAKDCTEIVQACTQSGVMLTVCHVLRYDPTIHKIKVLIDAGAIGDVIHIQHLEPVGYYHFAHSFVRGNWRNEAESSFALLAKSCHDIDLIHHWAGGRRCVKVSSFGALSHFKKENKPIGAGDRCLECAVERDCPYSARKIYLDSVKKGHVGWPVSVICPSSVPDIESVTEALKIGPYGRCVYECDNDVCTNQVVNMEFEGGLTAAFSMLAFTEQMCKRRTVISGSKGELSYDGDEIRVFDFLTQKITKHTAPSNSPAHSIMSGHGGADYHLIDAFISAVATNDPSFIRSGPEETLLSHKLVFEAEQSRLEGRVVHCGAIDQSYMTEQH